MSPHHQRRSTDPPQPGWKLWLWRLERIWQDVVPAIAVLAAAYAVFGYNDEADERRDQTCVAFERDAEAAVDAYEQAKERYIQSRRFLASVPPPEQTNQLTIAIRQSIPRLRAEVNQRHEMAKANAAPPYCDEENVGLQEPNPVLPAEPLP